MNRQVKQQRRRLKKENKQLLTTISNLQAKLDVERYINQQLMRRPDIQQFGTQVRLDRRNLGVFNRDDLTNMLQENVASNIAQLIVQRSLLRYRATLESDLDIVVSVQIGVANIRDESQPTIQDALNTIPGLEQIQERLRAYGGL
jgi:predicted nucleotidyltransferase